MMGQRSANVYHSLSYFYCPPKICCPQYFLVAKIEKGWIKPCDLVHLDHGLNLSYPELPTFSNLGQNKKFPNSPQISEWSSRVRDKAQ